MKRKAFISILVSLGVFISLKGYAVAQPNEEQLKAFPSIKIVRLVVEQSYGVQGVHLPFEKVAKRLLKYAKLKVVGANAKEYDATLKIKAWGRAVSANYIGGGERYSGASISGKISLWQETEEVQERIICEKSFSGEVGCPYEIKSSSYISPSSAPFSEVFREVGDFSLKILEITGEVYGVNAVIPALRDKDEYVRGLAAEVLGRIGDNRAVQPLIVALKDKKNFVRCQAAEALGNLGNGSAVEPLITILKDKNVIVQREAAKALSKITEEDFGKDQKKWQEWWERNKPK